MPRTPAPPSSPALIGASRSFLHVMSFNIRYDRPATRPDEVDYWPDRIAPLQDLLRREVPAVLGVQEALHHQLQVIQAALPPSYRMIGAGRDGGSRGEYAAIFYDAERLRLIEWDQFWLSDSPKLIGSSTWGNGVTRIVTWGRFHDSGSDREILLVNTHFDHESEHARMRSVAAVLDLVRFFRPGLPTIVMGDFNSDAGSSAYRSFLDSDVLVDTWTRADERLTPAYGTFPRYGRPVDGGARIDWILTTPDVLVRQVAVNTSTLDGRYPSDHAAVQALVDLPRRRHEQGDAHPAR